MPLAVEALVAITALRVWPHPIAAMALAAIAFAGSTIAFLRARRASVELSLDSGRLVVNGAELEIATVWLTRRWLVLRGRIGRRRRRLAIHEREVDSTAFARLRRHAIAVVPRVNPLRDAARRADRCPTDTGSCRADARAG